MNSIFTLGEVGLYDVPRVGGEAASLGELLKAGIPVPAAFIIPTTSYAEYLNQQDVRSTIQQAVSNPNELRVQLFTAPLPPVLERSLRASYRALSGVRDTFVLIRAGKEGIRVLGEEELIRGVKKIWADYLAQLSVSGEDLSQNPLPILFQQLERRDLAGNLLTSDPYSGDSGVAVVEVQHPEGKERLFFEKGTNQLTRRVITGSVNEPVSLGRVVSFPSWAIRIEEVLGGPRQLGWGLLGEAPTFCWTEPLYLEKRIPGAVNLWVRVDSQKNAIPSEVSGIITPTAEQAVALAQKFSSKPILLELDGVNEGELATFRRARCKEGLKNLHLILPPTRTVDGLRELKKAIAGEGLARGPQLKLYFRVAFPANVILLESFIGLGVDGAVFDSPRLARGFLGTEEVVESDDSTLWALDVAQQFCRKSRIDLLYYGDNLAEESVVGLLGRGVTQVAIDIANEKTLLSILSSAEDRFFEASHA